MDDFDRRVVEEIPRLQQIARYLTRDRVLADELLQSALLDAFAFNRRHPELVISDLDAWFSKIMHNRHRKHILKLNREGDKVQVDDAEEELAVPERQEVGLYLRDAVRGIDQLSPRRQEALQRVVLEEQEYGEVAAIMDTSEATVRKYISLGRRQIREIVDVGPGLVIPRRNWCLRREYYGAAVRVRDKGLEVNRTYLAEELKKKRPAVAWLLGSDVDLRAKLGVVTRPLHDADDYDRAIDALLVEDRVADKKRKVSHARVRRVLGIKEKSNNAVLHMLNNNRRLREKYANVLEQHHTVEDYERVIDELILENERAGEGDKKIPQTDIARKLHLDNKSSVSHFLTDHSILREKYEHWLIPTNRHSARLNHKLPVAAK